MADYPRAHARRHWIALRNSPAAGNDRGSPPDKVLRGRRVPESFEKPDRFFENVDHAIDLLARVVKIKTGARGSGHAEPAHQWLVTMMTTAHGETVTICKRGQIVRVRRVHDKTNDPTTVVLRAEHAQSGQIGHPLQRV